MIAYLNYAGNCEQAFRFYEEHLGAKVLTVMRHGQMPDTSQVPPGWENAVVHARLKIGDTELMGADVPQAQPMRSAYLTLLANSAEHAERLYELLSEGGEVFMKLEKDNFFASRFAMLRDRFGTSWMILHERPSETARKPAKKAAKKAARKNAKKSAKKAGKTTARRR